MRVTKLSMTRGITISVVAPEGDIYVKPKVTVDVEIEEGDNEEEVMKKVRAWLEWAVNREVLDEIQQARHLLAVPVVERELDGFFKDNPTPPVL